MRVLLELARFPAPDATALYDGARAVPWSEWLTAKTTLAVEATVRDTPAITHSGFAALKVKDAVVDALRDALGGRPDVDTRDPDVRIVLHLARGEAGLALDLAGEPLHKRGYRVETTPAPLKETLAAAVLALGGVAHDRAFLDPMCGSGTLAIEHALAARRIAPGLGRPFGFQRWPPYRGSWQSAWDRMKAQAQAEALPRAPAPIVARDIGSKVVAAAVRNATEAGVAADIRIDQGDARDAEPFAEEGALCTNPPYGERLSGGDDPIQRKKLEGFYRGFATTLSRFHGWDVVILSGSPVLDRSIPLRAEVSHRLWNGPIETRLLRYRVP